MPNPSTGWTGPGRGDPYGYIPDPSGIMGGQMPNFALNNPKKYKGPYGKAVQDIMDIIKGPDLPNMAGTQAATQGADQAAQGYMAGLSGGRADLASRGLSGSGVENAMVSSALGTLGTGEAAAGQAGSAMTQQMRDQLRMMVLDQLQKIGMGKAQAQYGTQQANLGLQSAQNAANSQKLGEMGSIFDTVLQLGGTVGGGILGGPTGAAIGGGIGGALGGLVGGGGGGKTGQFSFLNNSFGGGGAPSTPWLDPSQAYSLGGPYGNYMPSAFLTGGAGA